MSFSLLNEVTNSPIKATRDLKVDPYTIHIELNSDGSMHTHESVTTCDRYVQLLTKNNNRKWGYSTTTPRNKAHTPMKISVSRFLWNDALTTMCDRLKPKTKENDFESRLLFTKFLPIKLRCTTKATTQVSWKPLTTSLPLWMVCEWSMWEFRSKIGHAVSLSSHLHGTHLCRDLTYFILPTWYFIIHWFVMPCISYLVRSVVYSSVFMLGDMPRASCCKCPMLCTSCASSMFVRYWQLLYCLLVCDRVVCFIHVLISNGVYFILCS